MNVYDITLTCDHQMLVAAPSREVAIWIAHNEATKHKATWKSVEQIDLSKPGLLAWYPGPWSADAITDEDDEIEREGRAMAEGGLI